MVEALHRTRNTQVNMETVSKIDNGGTKSGLQTWNRAEEHLRSWGCRKV